MIPSISKIPFPRTIPPREMEHLDPTEDPDWHMLTERQRDFYRTCMESLLGERDLLQRAMR